MPHGERFIERAPCEWELPPQGEMRVPVAVFADHALLRELDPAALRQIINVASLPGIAGRALCLPDAHSGYGFPIGGVAAFDPARDGVVSAGGVGFDIACGVRTLRTGLTRDHVLARQEELAEALFAAVPSGMGRAGEWRLSSRGIDELMQGGASWAVGRGLGVPDDLARCEERGRAPGADPSRVSATAKQRFTDQLGTLGSGNHYLEIQWVEEILDPDAATAFGLRKGDALVSIHCGSRGLGHQIATDYLALMTGQAPRHGLAPPDRELACAPARSELGRDYLAAMRCGVNAALANRQAITHLVRRALAKVLPAAAPELLYDVSHNTCKAECHMIDGRERELLVHRKGATRALAPGHPDLPREFARVGQPVLVGGSMGTASYILAGMEGNFARSFASACHGAGRRLSRTAARKLGKGRDVAASLRHQGIFVRGESFKGIAEEAPAAYKDIDTIARIAEEAGLARRVARLLPLVCVKG